MNFTQEAVSLVFSIPRYSMVSERMFPTEKFFSFSMKGQHNNIQYCLSGFETHWLFSLDVINNSVYRCLALASKNYHGIIWLYVWQHCMYIYDLQHIFSGSMHHIDHQCSSYESKAMQNKLNNQLEMGDRSVDAMFRCWSLMLRSSASTFVIKIKEIFRTPSSLKICVTHKNLIMECRFLMFQNQFGRMSDACMFWHFISTLKRLEKTEKTDL